jgi:hypothetical protein
VGRAGKCRRLGEGQVLVRHEQVGDAVLEGREVVHRALYRNPVRHEGVLERREHLLEEDVLPARRDDAHPPHAPRC